MGLNAYFAYTVVLGMGYSWQQALAAVFVAVSYTHLDVYKRQIHNFPRLPQVPCAVAIQLLEKSAPEIICF